MLTLVELSRMSREEVFVLWHNTLPQVEEAKALIAYEQLLRKHVFDNYFHTFHEGTNALDFSDGSRLRGVVQFRREVNREVLINIGQQLRDMGLPVDSIVRWKPELDTTAYKALPEGPALDLLNSAIVTKPGLPALELYTPKRRK